jgi:hypothetical protein
MDGEGMYKKINFKMHNRVGAVLWTLAALIAVAGCMPGATAQTRTEHARLSAQVVNNIQRTKLTGAEPLVAAYGKDQGRLSSDARLNSMKLVLQRGSAEKAALKDFLAQVQDSSSANYHKWLTPEAFGRRFGASDEDIAAVSTWLQQEGFTVDSVSKSRTVITFSGSETQFENAFSAEMHHYLVNGDARIANSATPSIPTALAPAVLGIATLGNAKFRPAHTKPVVSTRNSSGLWSSSASSQASTQASAQASSTAVGTATPQFTVQSGSGYYALVGPADFGKMYGVQSLWNNGHKGAGQSIAIVAESNIAKSDVDAFRKAFGLPDTNLNVIVIGDDPGLDSSGSEGEAALDVQWAGAIAPAAKINLLVAASTSTTEGILIAAEYAIDNDLSPVLDVSWGSCELGLQASGNQYFDDLWAQASAQGISVMVASGDAGSAACDQNQYLSAYGQQVNGMASTEYATAVGGTDLYGNADGATHWTKSNDPTTLESLKSYITEAPWNDSCANPLLLAHASDFGLTETSNGEICSNEYTYLNTAGGGGGISLCTSSDGADQSSCTGGHAAPVWQQGFASMNATSKRHVPDVSFFSGAGLWGSAYPFCEADATTSTICVNNNGSMSVMMAGGTSFAAPAFAGVVALLNEQQGGRQGNINKYLYALAAKQFADSTLSANCQSGSSSDSSSCIFHDVVTGSIAVPCQIGTLVDLASSTNCTAAASDDSYGITPGYVASSGYDAATGLGSINVANLFSNWGSVVGLNSASQTTHTIAGATSVTYGSTASATINVKAATGTVTPTGATSLMSIESTGSTLAAAANYLTSGTAQVSFNTLTPGSHQVYATYGGDATFGSSSSTPTSFTVTKASTAMTAVASLATVTSSSSSTIIVKVQTTSTALNPTGSIVFTNQTTGSTLGTDTLTAYTDTTSGESWAISTFKISGSSLASGNNVIVASYAGDTNYLAASNQTLQVSYQPLYTVTSSNSSLTIDLSSSNQAATTITVGASSGSTVNPSQLSLTCEGISVTGVSCSFSTPTLNSSGAVTSTLTLTANNPTTTQSAMNTPAKSPLVKGTGLLLVACTTFLWIGRKRLRWLHTIASFVMILIASGCLVACGSSHKTTSPTVTNLLTVSSTTPTYGKALTMTSALSPTTSGTQPSGTVLFYDGAVLLGSSTVSGGKATLTTTSLAVGSHALSASYSGDSTFMPSTSTAVNVKVGLSTTVSVVVRDTAGNLTTLVLPLSIL